ncbi:rhodanese-like domain-containing protein [Brenneria corticis]|uniref:Sulfurtransferase n=1 Tax=Brenneria corticis TaxID=2173106 RepID=A0A2U1TLJ1_9GAMM|nr:rhodanese-like domain-containing protein [Brenneria sp. CFCC 11842]PWC10271.1 sulfurtransferase [Brenneria sp. CFCC 11842]
MTTLIAAATVKTWLHDGGEIALLDVREAGEFGEGHPLFAVSVPYSRLELDVGRLVPRTHTRIVLLGGENQTAEKSARRLKELGYQQVYILSGGLSGWRQAGYGVFKGVYVPSKAFGELVEHEYATPSLSAAELHALQQGAQPVLLLDGRPLDEFHKMSLPGAVCCPNAELPYRLHSLVADERIPVVINCAGRTRSILGAQILLSAGVRNPVYALENGTQGWYLQGYPLESGSARRYPPVDGAAPVLHSRREAARAFAVRQGVSWIDGETLQAWKKEQQRNLFVFDIRTAEEFAQGSLSGAAHAPGGQLLQNTDLFIGVRGARVVLADADAIRAPIIAGWLKQMGHEVYLLAEFELSPPAPEAREAIAAEKIIDLPRLAQGLAQNSLSVIDLRSSQSYRHAHLENAVWSIRPRIESLLAAESRPVVLVADDLRLAALAEKEVPAALPVYYARADIDAWRAAGLPLVSTPDAPPDAQRIDYLFFVHDRHAGNKEAARRYLAWETGLIDQLDAQERASFRLRP